MTPKEKAIDLINKMAFEVCKTDAKQCALIAVDEILSEFMFDDSEYADRRYKYYKEVKQEIEKL